MVNEGTEEVVLAEDSRKRFAHETAMEAAEETARKVLEGLKAREASKTETPTAQPTTPPATVADKLSGLTDDELADVASAVEEQLASKTPSPAEPKTVNAALKAAMKENPEQALSTYFQAAGEQQRKRDEAKRDAAETE
jgi:hypothetical protein